MEQQESQVAALPCQGMVHELQVAAPQAVSLHGSLWQQLLLNPAEPFNAWSHLVGACVALVGGVLLLIGARAELWPALVLYGLAMVGLFSFSALTHAVHEPALARYFELWDRSMIYLVIAGTYTPVVQLTLSGRMRVLVLVAIWLQAAIGIALTLSPLRVPRVLSVGLYLAMGWTVAFFLPTLWAVVGALEAAALLAGGIAYSIGAVIYALERPNPWAGRIGYHGLWHLWVLVGAGCFYLMVYRLMG